MVNCKMWVYIFFIGIYGICQGEVFFWKGEIFKGYFVTKDGRTQTVDEFINLTEFHTFIYRKRGILAHLPIVYIKSLRDAGGNQIQVTKKDGEVFTVQTWGPSGDQCMVFSHFQAEATIYANELYYDFHDLTEGKHSQSKISLCDIKKIVFG